MFDRRQFIEASLAAGLSSLLPPFAAAQTKRRFVDVHCHFFNAADIPVQGFLQRVVLADYARTGSASRSSGLTLSVWKGMVAKLVDLILRNNTPTPKDELSCLNSGSCEGFEAASAKAATAEASNRAMRQANNARQIADVLQQHYIGVQGKRAAPAEVQRDEDVDAFVDYVLSEMKAKNAAPPDASSRSMKSLGATLSDLASAIGNFISSGESFFSRYFDWAQLLTQYRQTIISSYMSLYDSGSARVILTTPALVDYNYWLQDTKPSPLIEQAELMGQLSLKQSHPMHGFVAFDPLRAVRRKPDERAPLDIVQEAIAKHGFLGVKLYSPMGFKPTDNAETGLLFPVHASQGEPGFGAALDRVLDELYAWCHAQEVPILAHTLATQAAGEDFAARAEPKFWEKVLVKYPRLKLNLAHFGNFVRAFSGGDAIQNFKATWEFEIAAYIKSGRYSNIYSDISYFYWVLEGSEDKDQIMAAKKLFAQYFEADPNCERLLFGTDWNMSGKAPNTAGMVDNTEVFFKDIGLGDRELDNLFFKNALRFLGLNEESKAKARLRAFYASANKPFPNFV